MKKFKFFGFLIVLALLAMASPAFALQCKTGNDASDECWTTITHASADTSVVNAGTILIYDFATATGTADTVAFNAIPSTAATDGYRVAGVAQGNIATGDRGLILVRGKGKIKASTAVTSGDRLFPSGTAGQARIIPVTDATSAASHDQAIAFALATTSAAATTDAYIIVV